MSYKIKALHDYVFFREEQVRAIGGIIIPGKGKTQESRSFGRVIAVGPGRVDVMTGDHIAMTVKVGDRIVLGGQASLAAYDHLDDKVKIRCIREPEISAIVSDDPAIYVHRAFDGENLCLAEGSGTEADQAVTCPKCVERMAIMVLS